MAGLTGSSKMVPWLPEDVSHLLPPLGEGFDFTGQVALTVPGAHLRLEDEWEGLPMSVTGGCYFQRHSTYSDS